MHHLSCSLLTALALASGICLPALAAGATAAPLDLSLEDLLKADIVTASRKAQAVQDVAAAVFVITRDDIERAGAASVPEALRLAPGVQVARLSSGRWAVSVRGFNSRFANKLLVLIDGRSVYSPLFSGVVWEMESTVLEDIDRIEVIRGPGAALWGANAVNGVINILTRKASDTQGSLVALSAGTVARGGLVLRHGGSLSDGHYRLWAKTESQRGYDDAQGMAGRDAWRASSAGFRTDLALRSGDAITLSGSVASSEAGDRWREASLLSPTGFAVSGFVQRTDAAHLLARYSWLGSDGSETVLQGNLAKTRVHVSDRITEHRTTADLDLQQRPRLAGLQDLVWGATARVSDDVIASSSGGMLFLPSKRRFSLASVFVNDEITLLPETLRATLGARLEHNSFTGLEPQAHARLAWTPNPTQTWWAALSRAVRTPSRAEPDAQVDLAVTPANPPVPAVLLRKSANAGSDQQAETVTAFELGYRQQVDARLAIDLTVFRNRYQQLLAGTLGDQALVLNPVPHVVQSVQLDNNQAGRTHGLEMVLDWRATRAWRVQAAFSTLRASFDAGSADPVAVSTAVSRANSAPRQQWSLRSTLALGQAGELDARLRHVSGVQQGDPLVPAIPAYTAFDLRYAVRPMPGLTLSLSGENLLDSRHAEFTPDLLPSQALLVPRSVHVKAQWQF